MSLDYLKAILQFPDLIHEPNLEGIANLKDNEVSPAFLKELHQLNYTQLSINEIIDLKIANPNLDLIKDMIDAGFDLPSVEELIKLSEFRVKPELIDALAASGHIDWNVETIIQLKENRVQPDYIISIHQLGFEDLNSDQLITLKNNRISLEYIKSIQAVGFTKITQEQLFEFQRVGVDPKFIQEIQALGFDDLSIDQVLSLKQSKMDAASIFSAKSDGHSDLLIEEYIELQEKERVQRLLEKFRAWKKGNGNTQTIEVEERQLSKFRKVIISGGIRAVITEGPENKVIIKGQKRMLPLIKTELKNGTLKVHSKAGFKSSYVYDIVVMTQNRRKLNQTIWKNGTALSNSILEAEQLFLVEEDR